MAAKTRSNPFQAAEDKALVERLLGGDEEAFRRFFDDSFGGLYRFALARLAGDEQAAAEIVQSTLTKAVEALETYRGEAALFTWLCAICRNEISAHRRSLARAPVSLDPVEEAPGLRAVLETLALDAEGPEEELRRRELVRLVHLTLDHLPARYGRALEWKYLEGLPVVEIAARLDVGPKAAESMLTRAREAFRRGFESLGANLDGGFRGLRPVSVRRSG
jgi:RNA polymerase sigma-70 factor (ECF subfamily)